MKVKTSQAVAATIRGAKELHKVSPRMFVVITLAAIVSALESQYGMDSNTITGGKVLTVSMTITGSASSDTMPSEYMLITVSGSDYPVLLDDSGDELVVTFRT